MRRLTIVATTGLIALFVTAAADPALAAGWGNLTGRVVFEGPHPKLEVKVEKGNPEVKNPECCKKDVVNDTLLINPENNGIKDVFVWVTGVDGESGIKRNQIHPKLRRPKTKQIVFDQKDCIFTPHSVVARSDQEVVIKSGDNFPHNTRFIPTGGINPPFNAIIGANDRVGVKIKFEVGERLPFEIKCDIHPWMNAWWLVLDHPYGTSTDEDGNFRIDDLPAGSIDVIVWQEKSGYLARFRAKDDSAIEIKAGADVQLDPITAKLDDFEFQQGELLGVYTPAELLEKVTALKKAAVTKAAEK